MTDHLGNVSVVASDKKTWDGTVFKADVLSYTDYYPFGMKIVSRDTSFANYRYGFQGQETDDEWLNGAVVYQYRMHDARIGRFCH